MMFVVVVNMLVSGSFPGDGALLAVSSELVVNNFFRHLLYYVCIL